jgi:hypothetical protein
MSIMKVLVVEAEVATHHRYNHFIHNAFGTDSDENLPSIGGISCPSLVHAHNI